MRRLRGVPDDRQNLRLLVVSDGSDRRRSADRPAGRERGTRKILRLRARASGEDNNCGE